MLFSGSHSGWRKESVDQLLRWRIATRASILGSCRCSVSCWARAAGLERFRRRPSLIWGYGSTLKRYRYLIWEITDITHLGYGSKLRILNIPQYLEIYQRMNRWTISYLGDIPALLMWTEGYSWGPMGRLGRSRRTRPAALFLGDTSISVEISD